jgi:hypothetical protein
VATGDSYFLQPLAAAFVITLVMSTSTGLQQATLRSCFRKNIDSNWTFIVGVVSRKGVDPLSAIQYVAIVPLLGALLAGFKVPIDTKNDLAYKNMIHTYECRKLQTNSIHHNAVENY